VVVDAHHFDKKQDPDPHLSENSDPDPHSGDADPHSATLEYELHTW
jgi:hypothetical protein